MRRILNAQKVAEQISVSVSQLRRMTKSGSFPKPIKLSKTRVGWLEADVDAWIERAMEGTDD